jgi:hypothetical protein
MQTQIVSSLVDTHHWATVQAEEHVFFFLDCQVPDPEFATPAKLSLATASDHFSVWRLAANFLEKVTRGDIANLLTAPRALSHSRSSSFINSSMSLVLDPENSPDGDSDGEERSNLA